MKNIISLNDFKQKQEPSFEKLTKAGISFRERFSEALKELEECYINEVNNATMSSQVKTKINISIVVKSAKASPLAAYSDVHKNWVETEINNALIRCKEVFDKKFPNSNKITIESLQKKLSEERQTYKAELSKLASQKMTDYLQLKSK